MSSGGNGSGMGVANAAASVGSDGIDIGSIPLASRKMVQSLKEIVSCSEDEIYTMLRECNMDPNETVNRLLTQDPFHEVKSKREKKKENKDTTDYKPRGGGNPSNRGGNDRRAKPTHYNHGEFGNPRERSASMKGNGTYTHAAPYSSMSVAGNTDVNQNVSSFSDNAPKETKVLSASRGDAFSSSVQPDSGFHSAWGGGNAGKVSMADIVKKDIPLKAPAPASSDQYRNYNHVVAAPLLPHHAMHPPHDHALSGPESDIGSDQHKDDWPGTKQPQVSAFTSVNAVENHETDDLHYNRGSQNTNSDDVLLLNEKINEPINEHYIASTKNMGLRNEDASDTSYYDNNVYRDPSSFQQYGHAYQHEEAEDNQASLSNMSATMQQLSLEKDEQAQPQKEEIRSVVIPDHLQVQISECLNLSFGSFGAGTSTLLSGASAADPLNNDVEEQSEAEVASPVEHSDYRNSEYYEDEQVRSTAPEDFINRSGVTDETQTSSSPSPPDVTKQDIHSEAEGAQYALNNSLPGYNFDNIQQRQLNAAYAQLQTSSQVQNTTPFSNVMAYANLSPASLLASTVQPSVRESDLYYSQFHPNQLMASNYGTTGSVGGPSAPVADSLEASNMSSSQQVLQSANVTTPGPGLPQHLAMHSYSQPTIPLGPFSNMISYPFLPPSYTYMPNAFQQAFNGNSSYHQSLASVLPQYKNDISVSSLLQSGAVPSGYGAFGGNSTNTPGNFSLNQNAIPGGSSIGYDEIALSQYKEHLLALHQLQNDNSAMYAQGNGTRTMSSVPANNTYYNNFQGHSQQPAGFRQSQHQQPSEHFNSPGYPNFYHSQSGMSIEHQQQNPRDGSQVQPLKQSQQQMWKNSY